MSNTDCLLMAILECGSLDLSILEDVGYDLGEIAENLISEGMKPTLNMITSQIFRKGQSELQEALKNVIEETEADMEYADEESEEYEKLEEKMEALQSLDPDSDIDWFCNCLDTSIWFDSNEEIYRKYLSDEISEIEDNMGFYF